MAASHNATFDVTASYNAALEKSAPYYAALDKRLLQDIAEIQQKPYPNIRYIPHDNDVNKACLILTPDGYAPLHLKVDFGRRYPLSAPKISIQSTINHPNVFGGYICATILNTDEGWTSAYTLKGICIQLLSFFGSDSLEQDHGGSTVNLKDYKERNGLVHPHNDYHCDHCDFATVASVARNAPTPSRPLPPGANAHAKPKSSPRKRKKSTKSQTPSECGTSHTKKAEVASVPIAKSSGTSISTLPDELLVLICSHLETEELIPFSRAWNRIGTENGIITRFNIIRNRELICYTLKRDFQELKLGVGVRIEWKGRIGTFESEFDLLSGLAFERHYIRRAVQANYFEHWLPLPISRRHYNSVKALIEPRLKVLSDAARYPTFSPELVVYGFMSDIVVRLSQAAEEITSTSRSFQNPYAPKRVSTLSHASEKAIESYYHLFHLLLCLATDNPRIVRTANKTIQSFLQGNTSKQHVPNLGHLLISVLISDADMTKDLLMAIIRETITRNVVWMLDRRGANMPELAYMEANDISTYRLQKTFDASLTSYRLLMFQNTFRRAINRGNPNGGTRSLTQLRDSLFDAHGSPPLGAAERLATSVRQLQNVKTFPEFLTIMGLTPPSAKEFTSFLRRTLDDSVKAGYSVWGISQERALTLRQQVDPGVVVREGKEPRWNGPGNFANCKTLEEGNRML
ncbi:hypothetical protein ES702_07073 [subsurface metagenome]